MNEQKFDKQIYCFYFFKSGEVNEYFTLKIHLATHTLNAPTQIFPGPYMDIHITPHANIYIYIHIHGQLMMMYVHTFIHTCTHIYS